MSESERRRLLSRQTIKVVVPTVAVLGVGGAIAAAAIPSADGTITGCYLSSNGHFGGNLRVVDSASDCTRLETAITWNQKGQQGPQGTPGAQGGQGPQGDTGPKGDPGAPGSAAPLIVGGEALQGGRAQAFLKLDGIDGESTDSKHKDEIDVSSFAFGVKQSETAGSGGGGAGAGKATFSAFHITKLYDKSSPKLMLDAADGDHIKSATLVFRKAGGDGQDFLTYKFTDLVVSDYEQGGTQEPPLFENVAMSFAKVEVSYQGQTVDGSAASPVQTGWDLSANKGT